MKREEKEKQNLAPQCLLRCTALAKFGGDGQLRKQHRGGPHRLMVWSSVRVPAGEKVHQLCDQGALHSPAGELVRVQHLCDSGSPSGDTTS